MDGYVNTADYPKYVIPYMPIAISLIISVAVLPLAAKLFKFGSGFLFEPMGSCPLAPVDFFVITLSGVITYASLFLIRRREKS